MGRLFGTMANRADHLREIFAQEHEALSIATTPAPDSWGLGFYQGGEVLHKKRPQLGSDSVDWERIAGDVRSTCVVGHARYATVGDFRAENTHPFRFRQWLFAHHGTVDRFDAIRPRLLASLPDFLARNIRGETDSEHFFHVLLSFLHEEIQLDNPDLDERVAVQSLRASVRVLDRWSEEVGGQPATLNLVVTNGRRMFALRRGSPMGFVVREGLHTVTQHAALSDTRAALDAAALRYALVVSGPESLPRGYRALDDRQVLSIDRDVNVGVVSL